MLQPLPSRLLVEREGYSFEVPVTYESLPSFCSYCHSVGHLVGECRVLMRIQATMHKTTNNRTVHVGNAKKNNHTNTSAKAPFETMNTSSTLPPVTDNTHASDLFAKQSPNGGTPPQSSTLHHLSPSPTEVCYAIQVDSNTAGAINHAIEEVFGPPSPNNVLNPQLNHNDKQHNQHSPGTEHMVPLTANHFSPSHNHLTPTPLHYGSSSSASSHKHSTSVESVVPCSVSSSKKQSKDVKNKPMHHSTSFYMQHTPTPSSNRSLSHNTFKKRFHNQFDPLSHWEGDGEGEHWDIFGESDDEIVESHNDNNHQKVHTSFGSHKDRMLEAPSLKVSDALNWGNMAEDEPFQSWEARADSVFEAATKGDNAQLYCLLGKDNRSSVLEQDFPPLQTSSASSPLSASSKPFIPSNSSSASHNSSATSSGTEYVPSPLKTRAQRVKTGTTALPLHRQKKMSKAAKREANAVSRLSKSSTCIKPHDPDDYQWQIYLKDEELRKNAATMAANANPVDSTKTGHGIGDNTTVPMQEASTTEFTQQE